MRENIPDYSNFLLILLIAGLLTSCFEPTPVAPEPEPVPPREEPPKIDDTEGVATDGVLEAVTWNLEWYGHPYGPDNEINQTQNFLTVIDTLNADFYAFQEVADQKSLLRLTTHMKGFRGFVAKAIDGSQKTAFVFNTKVIDSLSSGLIRKGQDGYAWGGGRYPFYFKFNYDFSDTTIAFYAVVIHAKCCTDPGDYQRRQDAAQSLYNYLTRNKPNANIILLGDYNDDVDVSIYQGKESPYRPFIINEQKFKVLTKSLSLKEEATSTVGYSDVIDHITISNELFDEYIMGSAKILTKATELISSSPEEYARTTTDHYPVWARFDL